MNEMITLFQGERDHVLRRSLGKPLDYEDVFTKLNMYGARDESVGLGRDYRGRFVR